MSTVKIRAALETALNGMSPALATAWENTAFTPAAGTPYQQVNMLFAVPSNNEIGSRYQQSGYMQVKLMYPPQIGTAAVGARAELIRATFRRGVTFVNGGVTTMITDTPEVSPGTSDSDRFSLILKIRFIAQIP